PGERVPVAGVRSGKCPGDVLAGDAGVDVGIVGHVLVVVVTDEAIAEARSKTEKYGRRQEEADEGLAFSQGPMLPAVAHCGQSSHNMKQRVLNFGKISGSNPRFVL